jgi:hypothetical protein
MNQPPALDLPPARSHSQLFTVRVWSEIDDGGQPAWRFKVQHVLSGETRFFNDRQDLMEFLVSYLSPG